MTMPPARARRLSRGFSKGGSPLKAAALTKGRPKPISTWPAEIKAGFWTPPPGTTLMMMSGSYSLMMGARPPAMPYQPPPAEPAVKVSVVLAATGAATIRERIRSKAKNNLVLMV